VNSIGARWDESCSGKGATATTEMAQVHHFRQGKYGKDEQYVESTVVGKSYGDQFTELR